MRRNCRSLRHLSDNRTQTLTSVLQDLYFSYPNSVNSRLQDEDWRDAVITDSASNVTGRESELLANHSARGGTYWITIKQIL